MAERKKESIVPVNGRAISIGAVVSVLVLIGLSAGGAIYVKDEAESAREKAVKQCQSIVDAQSRHHAPLAAVARLEAKMDAVAQGVTELRAEVRDLRRETRSIARRPPRPPAGRSP